MNKKHNFWKGIWSFSITDKNGSVVDAWEKQNDLADEGEFTLLDFMRGNSPSNFYVRLYNDTPIETDSLSDLTGEASGNGYSAQALNLDETDFPTLVLDSDDYMITTKSLEFEAVGGPIPASGSLTYAVLATSSDNTGKLIAYVALSLPRSLAVGEKLNITISIKLN